MKTAVLALLLLVAAPPALAGAKIDAFRKDIATYMAEQRKAPNRIIRYGDKNGAVARAVLNPARIGRVTEEAYQELNAADTLKGVLGEFKPVAQNYQQAFDQLPGSYDAEYMDSFEAVYCFVLAGFRPLEGIKAGDVPDEGTRLMIESALKMAAAVPPVLTGMLEKQISEGKFSAAFKPQAQARLARLRQAGQQASARIQASLAPPADATPAPAAPAPAAPASAAPAPAAPALR